MVDMQCLCTNYRPKTELLGQQQLELAVVHQIGNDYKYADFI